MADRSIPEVAEEEATGEVADIYADIKAQLDVPVVNLIFRRLAADADGLAWAWGSVRPAIVTGASSKAADRLVQGWPGDAVAAVPAESWLVVGVDPAAQRQIDAIIATYERANALNLVNLTCLSLLLGREDPADVVGPVTAASEETRPPGVADEPLPPMVDLADMEPNLRALVDRLSVRAGGSSTLTPSLYRHLAHWPGFLAIGYAMLVSRVEDGSLHRTSDDLTARARGLADSILDDHLAGQAAPVSPELRRAVTVTLEPFHATIPTMLTVATLLGELVRDHA